MNKLNSLILLCMLSRGTLFCASGYPEETKLKSAMATSFQEAPNPAVQTLLQGKSTPSFPASLVGTLPGKSKGKSKGKGLEQKASEELKIVAGEETPTIPQTRAVKGVGKGGKGPLPPPPSGAMPKKKMTQEENDFLTQFPFNRDNFPKDQISSFLIQLYNSIVGKEKGTLNDQLIQKTTQGQDIQKELPGSAEEKKVKEIEEKILQLEQSLAIYNPNQSIYTTTIIRINKEITKLKEDLKFAQEQKAEIILSEEDKEKIEQIQKINQDIEELRTKINEIDAKKETFKGEIERIQSFEEIDELEFSHKKDLITKVNRIHSLFAIKQEEDTKKIDSFIQSFDSNKKVVCEKINELAQFNKILRELKEKIVESELHPIYQSLINRLKDNTIIDLEIISEIEGLDYDDPFYKDRISDFIKPIANKLKRDAKKVFVNKIESFQKSLNEFDDQFKTKLGLLPSIKDGIEAQIKKYESLKNKLNELNECLHIASEKSTNKDDPENRKIILSKISKSEKLIKELQNKIDFDEISCFFKSSYEEIQKIRDLKEKAKKFDNMLKDAFVFFEENNYKDAQVNSHTIESQKYIDSSELKSYLDALADREKQSILILCSVGIDFDNVYNFLELIKSINSQKLKAFFVFCDSIRSDCQKGEDVANFAFEVIALTYILLGKQVEIIENDNKKGIKTGKQFKQTPSSSESFSFATQARLDGSQNQQAEKSATNADAYRVVDGRNASNSGRRLVAAGFTDADTLRAAAVSEQAHAVLAPEVSRLPATAEKAEVDQKATNRFLFAPQPRKLSSETVDESSSTGGFAAGSSSDRLQEQTDSAASSSEQELNEDSQTRMETQSRTHTRSSDLTTTTTEQVVRQNSVASSLDTQISGSREIEGLAQKPMSRQNSFASSVNSEASKIEEFLTQELEQSMSRQTSNSSIASSVATDGSATVLKSEISALAELARQTEIANEASKDYLHGLYNRIATTITEAIRTTRHYLQSLYDSAEKAVLTILLSPRLASLENVSGLKEKDSDSELSSAENTLESPRSAPSEPDFSPQPGEQEQQPIEDLGGLQVVTDSGAASSSSLRITAESGQSREEEVEVDLLRAAAADETQPTVALAANLLRDAAEGTDRANQLSIDVYSEGVQEQGSKTGEFVAGDHIISNQFMPQSPTSEPSKEDAQPVAKCCKGCMIS